MSADIFKFSVFALSSRGLMARAILPTNLPAKLADVASIAYTIKNLTDNLAPVTGNLSPAEVMFDTPQEWSKDPKGFYILWPVPGDLWPLAGKQYRIVLTFTLTNPYDPYPSLAGKSFILVWEGTTKDPLG